MLARKHVSIKESFEKKIWRPQIPSASGRLGIRWPPTFKKEVNIAENAIIYKQIEIGYICNNMNCLKLNILSNNFKHLFLEFYF